MQIPTKHFLFIQEAMNTTKLLISVHLIVRLLRALPINSVQSKPEIVSLALHGNAQKSHFTSLLATTRDLLFVLSGSQDCTH